MLYAFGFERVGVVLGDLYFVDPKPSKGQEGAEHGVRLELRVLDRGALKGTIYSATPIDVGRPIWRVDLLESVDGKPGSLDRVHHHPVFRDWDPTNRVFERELSADPLGWLAGKLADLDGVLADADFPADTAGPADAADLRAAAPEIVDAARRLLAKVRDGELGTAPAGTKSGTEPGAESVTEPGTEPVSVAAGEASGSGEAEPVLARAGWL
ncbi:MAG TPA: hypothetical protein VN969_29910 [Streptosporangiaceae bacterium]|jgi:hypothetical protein|nr:hypothetical protein [Streptosporangiaceae bacterium]